MPGTETCVSCCWYGPQRLSRGQCRRHAPTLSGFPLVYATDWCGDHTRDETTLPPPGWDDPDGDGLPELPPHNPASCRFCQEQPAAVPFAPE